MLLSISILLILAILFAELAGRIGIPPLVGMIAAGVVAAPYLSEELMALSGDLRTFALVVILMRAGLSLDLDLLRRSGRVTALLSFLPALFEIAGIVALAPMILGISYIDAAVMGCVVAAVSPAIIVPRMIDLKERREGRKVAQVIMAASSIDDLFVILLFSIFLKMGISGEFTPSLLLDLPLSIISGVVVGIVVGLILSKLFKIYSLRDTIKVALILAISLSLMALEKSLDVPFSPLLSVICIGAVLGRRNVTQGSRVAVKFGKVWAVAQLLLFSLVGASVDIGYAWQSGAAVVVVVLGALVWRVVGVWLSTAGGGFTRGERLFSMIAYTPKATVQAAIGAIPLSLGLPSGEIILSIAVVSILITAPFGAAGIDWGAKKLL
ncbi:MAG: cation:proton antiporter [Rikenellaceae bacterium]